MNWFQRKKKAATPRPIRARSHQPVLEELEVRSLLTNASLFAATLIVHSPEALTDFVANEYISLLHRLPDSQGLNGFVQMMENGMTPEAVEAAFVSSPEYIVDHGNTSVGFLNGLHRDLLGRAPDAAGLNNWLMMMARGMTATQVAQAFATSVERQSIIVTADYLALLGRPPEAGAVTFWVNQLGHGLNRADVETMIVGSDEFFQRQGNTNVNFIVAAYQDVLGRTPRNDEVNAWLMIMAQHP
jgi:hypothetical protein